MQVVQTLKIVSARPAIIKMHTAFLITAYLNCVGESFLQLNGESNFIFLWDTVNILNICQCYLTQLWLPCFWGLSKERLEVFWQQAHWQPLLNIWPSADCVNLRAAEKSSFMLEVQMALWALVVAKWKEVKNMNDSIIIFYSFRTKLHWPNIIFHRK